MLKNSNGSGYRLTQIILLGSIVIGAGRFLVPGHDLSPAGTYEAFAHLWCGFLIGLGVLPSGVRRDAWTALVVLSMIEVVKFLTR